MNLIKLVDLKKQYPNVATYAYRYKLNLYEIDGYRAIDLDEFEDLINSKIQKRRGRKLKWSKENAEDRK